VGLERGHIVEVALDAEVGADALQRRAGDARAEVVQHQPADGRVLQRRHLHADVATERSPDPVHLGRSGACDDGSARGEVERRRVVGRGRDPIAAAPAGKVGGHHAHALRSEAAGEEVEVARVAREAVHAEDDLLGIRWAPFRIAHAHQPMGGVRDDLAEARAQDFFFSQP
jgi:hypothetical protein